MKAIAHEKAAESDPSATAWTLRERLLGDMAPEAGNDADNPQSGENQLLSAVAIALEAAAKKEAAEHPTSASPDLRAAAQAIEAEAPLAILDLQFCRKVSGFGNFDSLTGHTLRPGQTFILYCEMGGLQYDPKGAGFHSKLESRAEIVSDRGGATVWKQSLGTAEDTCRHRRRDYYVNYRLTLPGSLPKGSYQFRLIQKDLLAGRETSQSLAIAVQ
jgi:hypothetical protein